MSKKKEEVKVVVVQKKEIQEGPVVVKESN